MKCASALSLHPKTDGACREVLDRVADGLAGEPGDLALAFVSGHHAGGLGRLAAEARKRSLGLHFLGCTAESIVGEDREIEESPAISLWAISLGRATLTPLRIAEGANGLDEIAAQVGAGDAAQAALILLGDPFTFPADPWLKRLNTVVPALRVIGGMASAGQTAGGNTLILDADVVTDGAVAVLVQGPVTIRSVVSQGCRPIGRPMLVTKTDQNMIKELGRRPAVQALRETFEALDEAEQELVQKGLHIGRVINEYQETFGRGDFLVRNVLGADDEGGLAITDVVRVGQTVQFHVRDADTADEDLRSLLATNRPGPRPAGALLFTCNGRGMRLFSQPNHDVGVVHEACGPIPVAGFFAMGELGPIGGQNFVHGFTASVALFEPKE